MRDKFILFLLSIFFGMMMALSPAITRAVEANVYDQNGNINYNEIDAMAKAQDGPQVKFVAADNGEIIFSDKPIVIADKSKGYMPSKLADLGYAFNPGAFADRVVTQLPVYDVVNVALYELPMVPSAPAVEAPVTQSNASPASATTAAPAAPATIISTSYSNNVVMQSALVLSMIVLFGCVLVYLINMIQASVTSSTTSSRKTAYHGEWNDSTPMVGSGEAFDFKRTAVNGAVIPMNTNALNMLCSIGKFSSSGTADTYFYMTYYVPSQHAYAAALREQKQKERQAELQH